MDQTIRDLYTDAILREAMRRYDIASGDIDPGDGFESFIYRYQRHGRPAILRITHTFRRTPELIRGEVDWINYLAAGGSSVASAVLSARGELVEEIDDGHGGRFLATAFAFAPGSDVGRAGGWTTPRREAYGRLIGRIHALTQQYQPADPAWRRPDWIDHTAAEVATLLPADDPALARYRTLVARVAALPRDPANYGLVHFDAHPGNFFVDGDRLTLFDFDDCAYNWFANDIAMVLFYHITNVAEPAAALDAFLPDFLRGYRAENAHNPAWASLIHDFMTMREIDLYAVILRSYNISADQIDSIPHTWPRAFMLGRRERIAAAAPYVEYEFDFGVGGDGERGS